MLRGLFLILCFMKITYQGNVTFTNAESFQILSRSKRQSQNYCVLPDHPANGEIKIIGQEQDSHLPNSSVIPNTIIDLFCREGTVTESGGLSRAICYQGKWKPSISQMGGCVRKCPEVQRETDTVFTVCAHKNPRIDCNNPIEGTVIRIVCKPFYEYIGIRPIVTCRNGIWDNVISPCQPECGKTQVSASDGPTAVKSQYPWVAGIYKSNNTQFIGGATVISRYFVLSAAHIFTTNGGALLDKSGYTISVGKYYRDFGHKLDVNMQFSRIKELYISDSYRGGFLNYAGDLAILTLEDPFIFTEYVQPICIDWTNASESYDLKEDNKGVIAGWGYTHSTDPLAEELFKIDVPYISQNTCLASGYLGTWNSYTNDKFCAGYIDTNKSVFAGDRGGGLFFQNTDGRFFIRGILSVVPRDHSGRDINAPGLYTRISTYLDEIERVTQRLLA